MKKLLVVLVCVFFMAACSNKKKQKEANKKQEEKQVEIVVKKIDSIEYVIKKDIEALDKTVKEVEDSIEELNNITCCAFRLS